MSRRKERLKFVGISLDNILKVCLRFFCWSQRNTNQTLVVFKIYEMYIDCRWYLQNAKPKHRKRAVIASSESENETESKEQEKENIQAQQKSVQSESSLDEDDNSQWETLRDKARKEKQNRRANVYNKYYYDWGTKYVG